MSERSEAHFTLDTVAANIGCSRASDTYSGLGLAPKSINLVAGFRVRQQSKHQTTASEIGSMEALESDATSPSVKISLPLVRVLY